MEHSSFLIKNLKIIKLMDLYHMRKVTHIYNIYNNIAVETLTQLLNIHQTNHRRTPQYQDEHYKKDKYISTKARYSLA